MTNIDDLLQKAKDASFELLLIDEEKINNVLLALADATESNLHEILEANRADLNQMDPNDPKYDRLLLNQQRIEGIAADIRSVANLNYPLNRIIEEDIRPNGMRIRKVSIPFGVIGTIYEARPNVSFDVFTLCFKTANVTVLKGGSDAENSNKAIVRIIHQVLSAHNINPAICSLLPSDRESTSALLKSAKYVDLIIPRGSSALINYVRENASMPVIETGAGICHTYFDTSGDLKKGREIIFNAKTRRVSVCNALDSLLIHKDKLDALPFLMQPLGEKGVIIYADEPAYAVLDGNYPASLLEKATPDSFGTEFLSYKLSIKSVHTIEEAIKHITLYSSKHSESIVAEDEQAKELFRKMVDAACVYTNVSTAFTDGAQFGFGAEIGISTQKLHARGPMALREITTYKYIIDGDGQVRTP